jgi:hypothetical protein
MISRSEKEKRNRKLKKKKEAENCAGPIFFLGFSLLPLLTLPEFLQRSGCWDSWRVWRDGEREKKKRKTA